MPGDADDGHGANQFVNQAIELGVRNQMSGLLAAQRPAQHARQADYRLASARQAVRCVVFADQLASHAKHRSLQTEEVSITRLEPIHLAPISCSQANYEANWSSGLPEVTRLVQPVDKV